MLWYKYWRETRFRALLGLAVLVLVSIVNRRAGGLHPEIPAATLAFMWAALPCWVGLSGAGVRTQPTFRATKGEHGSMYFTLAMPVSRLRLLCTRAAVGLMEFTVLVTIMCVASWVAIPALRAHVTPADLFAYIVTVITCTSGFYFLSVVYATLIDEGTWLPWAGMVSIAALAFALPRFHRVPAVNVFAAMGLKSPLFTHAYPWSSMAIAVGAAAVLFFVASRTIQARQY